MAKRRQNLPSANNEAVRWVIFGLGILIVCFLAVQAVGSFLHHAKLFLVRDISVAKGLEEIGTSELEKMKGHNIFDLDLTRIEEKLRKKYPCIGDLGVIKRFPDQIQVTGFPREPVAVALVGSRALVFSRDGFFMDRAGKEDEALPRVRGFRVSKAYPGDPVDDIDLGFVLQVLEVFQGEKAIAPLFRGIDIEDPTRLVADMEEGKASFDVFLDRDHVFGQIRKLAEIIGRTDLDLKGTRYIDLRFGEPIVGRKKTAR